MPRIAKEKKVEKKFYLTEKEVEMLANASVYFHKNLSDTLGLIIKQADERIKQDKAEINFKEQLNAMEFITSINEQILNLEKKFEKKAEELDERISNHKMMFMKKDNEIIQSNDVVLSALQGIKLIGGNFNNISLPKEHK